MGNEMTTPMLCELLDKPTLEWVLAKLDGEIESAKQWQADTGRCEHKARVDALQHFRGNLNMATWGCACKRGDG